MVVEESPYSVDFPEMARPFQICNGAYRRRQTYRGISTALTKNATTIVFPRLTDEDGNDLPTSGAAIATRGIGSGIRGLKFPAPTGRPDCVLLDDLLDAKSAGSEETNEKLLSIIQKDIFNLSSGKKLGICMTSTPLLPDDLTDRIRNDKAWKTIRYPAIIHYPTDILRHPEDGLWAKYFSLFDGENERDEKHTESLKFYKANKERMDEGAELFQDRFKRSDGHISGLQALLEKRHVIGNSAFQAEMQLAPVKYSLALDIMPKDVLKNETEDAEGVIPDGFRFAVASSDLNLSFCISTTIVAFKADGSAHILKHIFRKCGIMGRVADAAYNAAVYEVLVTHGKEIAALGIPIKGWAIDCNGLPFEAVTSFVSNSKKLCGIDACGFVGRASHIFNPNIKSRLRSEIARTVLCGDAQEIANVGTGKRWVAWDSDYYRERVHVGFLRSVGNAGAITLYHGEDGEHRDYAAQICAEKLKMKRTRSDGRTEYQWKSSGDHDMLDSTAQAFACAAQFGISGGNFAAVLNQSKTVKTTEVKAVSPLRQRRKKKRRISFV